MVCPTMKIRLQAADGSDDRRVRRFVERPLREQIPAAATPAGRILRQKRAGTIQFIRPHLRRRRDHRYAYDYEQATAIAWRLACGPRGAFPGCPELPAAAATRDAPCSSSRRARNASATTARPAGSRATPAPERIRTARGQAPQRAMQMKNAGCIPSAARVVIRNVQLDERVRGGWNGHAGPPASDTATATEARARRAPRLRGRGWAPPSSVVRCSALV